jgi:23S rRNA maturation-related 3'-5' exoribonuclease YhaM
MENDMKTHHELVHALAEKSERVAELEANIKYVYDNIELALAGLDKGKLHVTRYFLESLIEQ